MLSESDAPAGGHAGHELPELFAAGASAERDPIVLLDAVHATAREAGIDSTWIEIRPARAADQAWLVREYDRRWPTQVDTVAIDARTMTVTSRADFETFPLVAKLIRWGIDAHMGILFGIPNQLVLAGFGLMTIAMIAMGYAMWWQRRPAAGQMPLLASWSRMPTAWRWGSAAALTAFGWALPVMGASLLCFVLIDAVRWKRALHRKKRLA